MMLGPAMRFILYVSLAVCFLSNAAEADWAGRRGLLAIEMMTHANTINGSVKDGSACRLRVDLRKGPPACAGGFQNCLIDRLGGKSHRLHGVCNSKYVEGSHCSVGEFNFKVGVKHIPAYGPMKCVTCSCNLHPRLNGTNKATCDCDPLPPCHVDSVGTQFESRNCSYYIPETLCIVTKPAAASAPLATMMNEGKCAAPWDPVHCESSGPDWGPIFYAVGTKGVPFPGDRCKTCTCAKNGILKRCAIVPGCTQS